MRKSEIFIFLILTLVVYFGVRSKIYLIAILGAILFVAQIFSMFGFKLPKIKNTSIVVKTPKLSSSSSNDKASEATTTTQESTSQNENTAENGASAESEQAVSENSLTNIKNVADIKLLDTHKTIEVDGGDLSGHRESNVIVNIGFGNRNYYAITNEYGQLVVVLADEIILQNDRTEPVLESGRYYPDEAKVPGTESPTLDEGHVIADSLGGVSNAYNITPQDSTVNRHGAQAEMEKAIRKAGGCTNFSAVISYPNNETQTPSYYSYKYTIDGQVYYSNFENAS